MDLFANTSLAESSRTLYSKKLKQFISFIPIPNNGTIDYIIDNPEEASKILHKESSIAQTSANRHMFFSAVVAYLKHTDQGRKRSEPLKNRWETIQKNNWEERRQQSINNEPSPNQITVAESVSWEDIIKKRNDLKPGLERLLLSMYTYIPPVRADYFDVRINPPKSVIDNSKDNFIVFDKTHPEKSVLVIRDFKTANKYKEIKHALPLQLYKEIQLSLTEKPRDYLFVMPTNATRPYDRGSFSKWANKVLQSLFNVSITLTSLRHLFVSTLDFNNTRASELEKIGNSMGHSIAMQKGYQWIQ
jgi:hypothetical protein